MELGPLGEHFLREVVDAGLSNAQRAVVGAIPKDRRSTKREAAVAALATLSARLNSPLLVIEDARRADYMLTVAKRWPLMILTTTRPDNGGLHTAIREAPRYAPSLTIALSPLRQKKAAPCEKYARRNLEIVSPTSIPIEASKCI